MIKSKSAVKDILCFTCFTLSLAAVFYFSNVFYNYLASATAILCVYLFRKDHRENIPILLFVLGVILVELTLNVIPAKAVLLKYTTLSLLDLLLAFLIVHYHNDSGIYRFFKVQEPAKRIPQVYLMSLVLACTSLLYFALASEVVLYHLDKNFYGGDEPFFHRMNWELGIFLKILFDLTIWSLLLDPNRWKFLRQIEQRYNT